MAKNNQNEKDKQAQGLSAILSTIQNGLDKAYSSTYYNDINWSKDLSYIKKDMDDNLDSIINNNLAMSGKANISRLYQRISDTKDIKADSLGGFPKDIANIFSDDSISSVFTGFADDNKYIKDKDEEIDIILKYFPLLEDALDAKKDNVLSADQYSKDFINATSDSNIQRESTFGERIKELKAKYDLIELYENMYDETSKYGESFVYIVNYASAIQRLLDVKNGIGNGVSSALKESAVSRNCITEASINLTEGVIRDNASKRSIKLDPAHLDSIDGELKLTLDTSGVLREFVDARTTAKRFLDTIMENKFDKTINSDLSFEGFGDSQEGLISTKKSTDNITITATGFIIKQLKRENVIPIYIDDMCLGYYYIENENFDFNTKAAIFNNPMRSLKHAHTVSSDLYNTRDNSLKYLSDKLSTYIDSKFVNANCDLKNEIYMILKQSNFNANTLSEIKVTYIPPEDMEHMYFKMDKRTHRGVSDLERSLIPAKLYVSLYVSTTLAVMTRGFDQRVYYVKQNIDTNISQLLLNTINQIKRANYGTREFESIKNILNITGRYNDRIVPVGADGSSPVTQEIMPGQNIDIKSDLLDMLEHNAINSTDVPYEYIQARQGVDFAIRLTMANGKFLRKSFKRQAKCEPYYSRILTRLYNGEYGEDDIVKVSLPAPAFLNIANTTQMIDNVDQYISKMCDIMIVDGDENPKFVKEVKRKLMIHYLNTYIDTPMIDELMHDAKMEEMVSSKPEE